jgi:hypothetical protein
MPGKGFAKGLNSFPLQMGIFNAQPRRSGAGCSTPLSGAQRSIQTVGRCALCSLLAKAFGVGRWALS